MYSLLFVCIVIIVELVNLNYYIVLNVMVLIIS